MMAKSEPSVASDITFNGQTPEKDRNVAMITPEKMNHIAEQVVK